MSGNMRFLIEDGRGGEYEENVADAIREAADELTSKGIRPSEVHIRAPAYERLREETNGGWMPELDVYMAMQERGSHVEFNGMRLVVDE